jgi:hypothetical protein
MKRQALVGPGSDELFFIASLVFGSDFLRWFLFPHFIDEPDRFLILVQAQLKVRRCGDS